jgi:hypothetical protein
MNLQRGYISPYFLNVYFLSFSLFKEMCKMDFEGRRLLEEKKMRQDFIPEENRLKLWIRLEWTIRRESIGRLEGGKILRSIMSWPGGMGGRVSASDGVGGCDGNNDLA